MPNQSHGPLTSPLTRPNASGTARLIAGTRTFGPVQLRVCVRHNVAAQIIPLMAEKGPRLRTVNKNEAQPNERQANECSLSLVLAAFVGLLPVFGTSR